MIISVASGKGGTGKTLVATSLALSLRGQGNVQLVDCNVEGPAAHIFLKPAISRSEEVLITVPRVDEGRCTYCGRCAEFCAHGAIGVSGERIVSFPELCHGCGACSYLCAESAIFEEERKIGIVEFGHSDGVEFAGGRLSIGELMASLVIRRVKQYVASTGTVIIDSPSGSSGAMIEAVKDSNFCLLVTEPTPFGFSDLVTVMEIVKGLNIPCSVVINRARPGDEKAEEFWRQNDLPVLLTIPLDTGIAGFYSRGIPLVEGIPEWQQSFIGLFSRIREAVVAGSR